MTFRPEQLRAREYLRDKGSRLPADRIRERVAGAFAAMEALLAEMAEADARVRPRPREWSVQEVVDHLVETHRPSIAELRDLLAGRRPPGPPIPAALQSADPMSRAWADLVRDLGALHAETLGLLAEASDAHPLDARAPLVMVVDAKEPDGSVAPLHWIEELDWKAYAIVFRLHTLDHANQIKRTRAALEGRSSDGAPRDAEGAPVRVPRPTE